MSTPVLPGDGRRATIATAPNVTLSVPVAGTGPLVILIYGWFELGLSWRRQIAPLVAAIATSLRAARWYGGRA